jgi:hypothetical protein
MHVRVGVDDDAGVRRHSGHQHLVRVRRVGHHHVGDHVLLLLGVFADLLHLGPELASGEAVHRVDDRLALLDLADVGLIN